MTIKELNYNYDTVAVFYANCPNRTALCKR